MQLSTITNGSRLSVDVLDFGARITAVRLDDIHVACGYPKPDDYRQDPMYLGATIGPICNRIANGVLVIDGKQFQMPRNDGRHTLHSGGDGFDQHLWSLEDQSDNKVHYRLQYDLARSGLSGRLVAEAIYEVVDNALQVHYKARCDLPTYVNMTNHVYLNLSGQQRPIDDHEFTLFADSFVNVDEHNIPTGSVTRLHKPMTYSIDSTPSHTEFEGQCDHHFNVAATDSPDLRTMLHARSRLTGIKLEVAGTAPGFQFYTGRHMKSPFGDSGGFCVETQYAPDAVNQPGFYSPILQPNKVYQQTTQYRFT